MSPIRLHVLGTLSLDDGERPIHVSRRKAQALLVYLALSRQAQQREALAALLWPEATPARARGELRRCSYELRKSLGCPVLIAEADTLELKRSAASLWVDALHYRALLAQGDVDALRQAVGLYNGDLLAGFTLADAPEFEEWRYFEAESLRQAQSAALGQLVNWHAARGQYGEAIGYARQRLAMDPTHEPAHRELMKLHAWSGQLGAARRQYEQCRAVLAHELGMPPDEETCALYDQIRSGKLAADSLRPAITRHVHDLPQPGTPFVGRVAELARVADLLADANCRLLTIVGPGGIGKTRLAVRAAHEQADRFADSICYVDLAPVEGADLLAATVLQALNAPDYGSESPERRLFDLLHSREMLLVLDNFEQLIDGVELLPELLQSAPGVKLLVTSRERLNLAEEWLMPLEGLELPPHAETGSPGTEQAIPPSALETYDATKLFVQCVHRLQPTYAASPSDAGTIVAICRLVEGMPLGIELAAAWTRTLSPAEILREMVHSLEFLSTSLRDVPARHRSMHAVFDQSWRHLSERERSILRRMSVFRGGCTRDGAEVVARARLTDLAQLVDRSWLQRLASGRYTMHELARQYCEEKLESEHHISGGESPGDVHRRHCSFIGDTVRASLQKVDFEGAAYDEIVPELGNLQAAWRHAVETLDSEAGQKLAQAIWFVGDVSGKFALALQTLEPGAVVLEAHIRSSAQNPKTTQRAAEVLAWIRFAQIDLYLDLGRLEAASDCLEKLALIIELMEPGGAKLFWQAELSDEHAYLAFQEGDFDRSYWRAKQTLAMHQDPRIVEQFYGTAVGPTYWRAESERHLALAAMYSGRYDEAVEMYERSMALSDQIGEGRWKGFHLAIYSQLNLVTGDYGRAEELAREALLLVQRFNDQPAIARSHLALGFVAMAAGRDAEARAHLGKSVAICTQCGSLTHHMRSLNALGILALERGDVAEGGRRFDESLAVFRRTGTAHCMGVPGALLGMGWTALAEGNLAKAGEQFLTVLATGKCAAWEKTEGIAGLAEVAAREGRVQDAAELLALVAAHPFTAFEQRTKSRERLETLRQQMPPDVFAARVSAGERRDLDATIGELARAGQP